MQNYKKMGPVNSGGARVLDQGGAHFFSVGRQTSFSMNLGCLYGAPLAAPIRVARGPHGAPLPPEAPYPIHQQQRNS